MKTDVRPPQRRKIKLAKTSEKQTNSCYCKFAFLDGLRKQENRKRHSEIRLAVVCKFDSASLVGGLFFFFFRGSLRGVNMMFSGFIIIHDDFNVM